MNKKIVLALAAVVIAIAAFAVLGKRVSHPTTAEESGSAPNLSGAPTSNTAATPGAGKGNATPGDASTPGSPVAPKANTPWAANPSAGDAPSAAALKLRETPLSAEEAKSVKTITASMAKFVRAGSRKPQAMLNAFKSLGMAPVMAKDFNPYTGKMLIIRADNPLPGTRYNHAQYFEDESKQAFPQHISVEVRPGKDSFDVTEAAIVAALKDVNPNAKLGKPDFSSRDGTVKKWNLADGYEARLGVMTKEKLSEPSVFNAYNPVEDQGTTRFTIEQNPHTAHGEDHETADDEDHQH